MSRGLDDYDAEQADTDIMYIATALSWSLSALQILIMELLLKKIRYNQLH